MIRLRVPPCASRRRVRFGGSTLAIPAALFLTIGLFVPPVLADDRPMRRAESDDDSRLTEGQLGHSDLLGAGDRAEDTEARVQAHLEAARRYLDVDAYDAAMAEIDAADRLVPFHEDVMALLELAAELRDSARRYGMALSQMEEERRASEARAVMEREEAERRARAADEIIAKYNLPRGLDRALVELLSRQRRLEERRAEARLARERCIGAAARVHAHGAGRQCRTEEDALALIGRLERELDADLAVLTSAYRERHGQQALDQLMESAQE